MFSKLRKKTIQLLAFGDPVLLNWNVNMSLVKDGVCVVYVPPKDTAMTKEQVFEMGVLTPIKLK